MTCFFFNFLSKITEKSSQNNKKKAAKVHTKPLAIFGKTQTMKTMDTKIKDFRLVNPTSVIKPEICWEVGVHCLPTD